MTLNHLERSAGVGVKTCAMKSDDTSEQIDTVIHSVQYSIGAIFVAGATNREMSYKSFAVVRTINTAYLFLYRMHSTLKCISVGRLNRSTIHWIIRGWIHSYRHRIWILFEAPQTQRRLPLSEPNKSPLLQCLLSNRMPLWCFYAFILSETKPKLAETSVWTSHG